MAFYENLGFSNHPFAHTNADEEAMLSEYFIPPPFFDAVIGDPQTPNASIVFAPRGGGKTAQRLMVEREGRRMNVLPVTYDRFEFSAGQEIEDIGLQYHIRNIIIRILVTLLATFSENPEEMNKLERQSKKTLSSFISTYLGPMTSQQFQEILNNIRSIPERIKTYWHENLGIFDSLINYLLKRYDLDIVTDAADIPQDEKTLSQTYKFQLQILLEIVRELGIGSIYVLIDKLDETEKTGASPENTFLLLRPILLDLELLSLDGYGFKLFVWDKILPLFREHARPDRVPQHNIEWDIRRLQELLNARLSAFSEGKITSFKELLAEEVGYDVDYAICLFANKSPRNVIRICEKILAVQAEMEPESSRISSDAIDRGILLFCKEITNELYGQDTCNDLKRTGRELFTISYLASSIFKTTHENTSRNKVTNWQDCGVVTQVDTVTTAAARRPLNFYYVCDPAMVRVIHERVPLEEFLKDRLLECGHCRAANLVDLSIIPEGNNPRCYECGRNLV